MLTSEKLPICFVDDSAKNTHLSNDLHLEKKHNLINLYKHFFDYIPKLFKIMTKNGSCYFNTEILSETSLIVNQILKLHNYEQRELYINVNDENNVLQKVGLLYQGKSVLFDKNDYPVLTKILNKLDIRGFPINLFYENNDFVVFNIKKDHPSIFNARIKISEKDFYNYLLSSDRQFIISTKKRDYTCKLLGVFSSEVIRDFFIKNPNSYRYEIDFADENNEFQIIADIFNFKTIEITENNIETLNSFAEELQITSIFENVHKYMDEYEKYYQIIDEQSETVDMIDELFDWLYHINLLTVEKVKNLILESRWVKTEDNIKELVAFIFQTIESEMRLNHFLGNLVIELDKEANDKKNKLSIFLPFLVKMLMKLFTSKNTYCSFVCFLMSKGVIQKEEIMKKISSILDKNANNYDTDAEIKNILLWFLPEIFELKNDFFQKKFFNSIFSKRSFLKNYIPDKIDFYKKMRDSGEPDDEITKALRNDDVDYFQKLILPNINKISKCVVPFNIFEDYIENGSTNYINYAAAYGSIKCFKYLLLNHIEIDEYTFNYAIYGGNIEIIKIVDQNSGNVVVSQKNQLIIDDKIILPIIKHQNDLFDWIYEQKYLSKSKKESIHKLLISKCADSGNAHVIMELINQRIDISQQFDVLYYILQTASKKGFYQMTKFLFNIIQIKLIFEVKDQNEIKIYAPFYIRFKNSRIEIPITRRLKNKKSDSFCFESSVYFGNLSIFQLYEPIMNQTCLEKAILFSIENSFTQIVDYFIDQIVKNRSLMIRQDFLIKILCFSLMRDNSDLFNLYIDKLKKNIRNFSDEYILDYKILETACKYKHIDTAKMITDLILIYYNDRTSRKDFTSSFIEAFCSETFEICKYFIDKQIYIDYKIVNNSYGKFKSINAKIVTLILENEPSYLKKIFVNNFVHQAIKTKSYESFDILLNNCPPMNDLLYEAVNSRDIELAKIVLKYKSNSSYVNKFINGKTVLHIALTNGNIDIAQLLLSIPGIDVNIIDSNGNSPLMIAYNRNYDNIIEMLLKNENIDTNILINQGENFMLINAIENKKIEIAKLIIKHPRTNINFCFNNETPLIAAVKNNLMDIVDLLINNEKFDPEESLLDNAFYISSGEMVNLLISAKNLDVNFIMYDNITKMNEYKTTLTNSIELKQTEKVKLIINHPSFDKDKSDLSTAIYNSIINNEIELFDNLLKFANSNDDISRVFTISSVLSKEMILEKILDFNNQNGHFINFNQLLPNSKSFFTFIPSGYHDIQKLIHTILENGGDPNIPDGFGIYPLQYAIEIKSYEYISELINSNKIDFEKKIDERIVIPKYYDFDFFDYDKETIKNNHNKSYLHFAARSKKEIFSLFLDKNLIDINITDNLGETPLMEACRHKKVENIQLLFEKDDLDYLHCNNDGEDALHIIFEMYKVYHSTEGINSKDEYLKLLISIIQEDFFGGLIQLL